MKKSSDRNVDLQVRAVDNILDGQSTITNNQGSMAEQLLGIQNTLDHHTTLMEGQRNSREDQSGAAAKESVGVQETDSDKKKLSPESKKETNTNQRRKLSKEMPLKELWAKQGFRDEFSNEMNVEYKLNKIKHWPYLAEEFGIKRDKIDECGTSDIASPSESMLEMMERKKPYLKIEELCQNLRDAKAYDVLKIVEKAIRAQEITPNDLVSDMWDKSPEGIKQVILNLDKKGVWKDVAKVLGFTKKHCQSFERNMDPALNPTRDLFDVLRTQRPQLKVKDFEEKLDHDEIDQGVLKILDDNNVSGDMPLRKLSEIPNIMLEIELILNDPKDESLWRLAESFKTEDGVDIDVEMFRHRGTDANPTYHLMEHIIARFPEEQTIQDLIKHLLNINRRDCLGIIAEYLEGGNTEIEKLCQEMEKLMQIGEERKDALEGDNDADDDTVTAV